MGKEFEEQEKDIWTKNLVLLHSLSNIEITKYFNCEPRFIGVYSRENLLRINHAINVINLWWQKSKWTHWVSSLINKNMAVYFDSFGIEYIKATRSIK